MWSHMELEDLAKRIRDACVEAVLEAYDDAAYRASVLRGAGRQL